MRPTAPDISALERIESERCESGRTEPKRQEPERIERDRAEPARRVPEHNGPAWTELEPADLELTDADVLDAMQRIPGYLDISTEDFRSLYQLAHAHASERLFNQVKARQLMRTAIEPLRPALLAGEAARALVSQNLKSLPVVDASDRVLGILTETDLLRCLGATSHLELLFDALAQVSAPDADCRERSVAELMTQPAITIHEQASVNETLRAFRRHPGRSMPVVDGPGRLRGLLLRKDFLHACHLGEGS
jgi:CBS domain-containing membrane protein